MTAVPSNNPALPANRREPRAERDWRVGTASAAVLILAAVLRLSTLGSQSYWFDEGVTVNLLHRSFGGMLHALPHSESTPPLYYIVAWVWARLFGFGEIGLRLLSAIAGVAAVAVVAVCGRRFGGWRVGTLAAALAAANPLLVWYSQEARSYSLLALLCSASFAAFLGCLDDPGPSRAFVGWGIVSALALATHYFAAFVVGPEFVWLAARFWRRRAALLSLGIVLTAALALLPLAIAQRNTRNADFIAASSFSTRVLQVFKQLLTGYGFPGQTVVTVLAAALTAVALISALRSSQKRAAQYIPLTLAAAVIVTPLILAAFGLDYVLSRNLIAVCPLLAVVLALGIDRLPRGGLGLTTGLIVIGVVVVALVDVSPRYQRDNWRGAIHAAIRGGVYPKAIVVNSTVGQQMFRVYAPPVRALTTMGTLAREIDVVALALRPPGQGLKVPPISGLRAPHGFHLAGTTTTSTYALVRYEAAAPTQVLPATLAGLLPPQPLTFLASAGPGS